MSRKLQYPDQHLSNAGEKINFHEWFQFNFKYENYFKRKGRIKFGLYFEFANSGMPFFANYISSVLNSPGFYPIQESKTIFLPSFRAHTFGGLGSKNVITLKNNIDILIDGYVFQPYQELLPTPELKTYYGDYLAKRYYVGSLGTVFHSPLGPIGFFLNYFDNREKPFSFLFHFGYFIFNKNALN